MPARTRLWRSLNTPLTLGALGKGASIFRCLIFSQCFYLRASRLASANLLLTLPWPAPPSSSRADSEHLFSVYPLTSWCFSKAFFEQTLARFVQGIYYTNVCYIANVSLSWIDFTRRYPSIAVIAYILGNSSCQLLSLEVIPSSPWVRVKMYAENDNYKDESLSHQMNSFWSSSTLPF